VIDVTRIQRKKNPEMRRGPSGGKRRKKGVNAAQGKIHVRGKRKVVSAHFLQRKLTQKREEGKRKVHEWGGNPSSLGHSKGGKC